MISLAVVFCCFLFVCSLASWYLSCLVYSKLPRFVVLCLMLQSVNIASIISYIPLFFLFLVFPLCKYYTFCSCPTIFWYFIVFQSLLSLLFSFCSLCQYIPKVGDPSSVMSNSTSESIKHYSIRLQWVFFGGWGASQVSLVVKNPLDNAGDRRRCMFDLWVGKIPWRRAW